MATKRPDGRVEPGQRISSAFSARAWNRAQDAADVVLGARTGAEAGPITSTSAPYQWVYAKNGTASTVNRWGIMAITGVEVTPTSDAAAAATVQFQSMPVITGGTPAATTTAWCVALEPITANKIGRVAVAGVVQVKLDVTSADDKFAACKASSSELKTGTSGEASILWKETGTGAGKWALVRFGGVGAGGGVRLGTVSATWTKGNTATVTEQNGDGSAKSPTTTFTAKNYFATVTVASGTKRVACAKVDDTWILLAAEC
jgi:hypothetical protein